MTKPSNSGSPTAQVTNPINAGDVDGLPKDAVALLIWRDFTGPQPLTVVVTRASWDMNRKVVMDAGSKFEPDRIYEFESPTNPAGRKTIFHFQGIVGWAANLDTGIIPVKMGL